MTELNPQVCPDPRLDLVGSPEWCPNKVHLHVLDARKGAKLALGVAHDLWT